MLKEFKEFAFRGNLLEVAIGLVLALAFTAAVTALVDGVIMPLVAAIVGEPSFDAIVWTIGSGADATEIQIGRFLTAVVNFVLIACVLFWIVKTANRLTRARADDEADAGPTELELLTEIRDALRRRPD